jgi:hypothetical protein
MRLQPSVIFLICSALASACGCQTTSNTSVKKRIRDGNIEVISLDQTTIETDGEPVTITLRDAEQIARALEISINRSPKEIRDVLAPMTKNALIWISEDEAVRINMWILSARGNSLIIWCRFSPLELHPYQYVASVTAKENGWVVGEIEIERFIPLWF